MFSNQKIDVRYSESNIVSHQGNEIASVQISDALEIIELSKDYEVVGIDEAQFFSNEIVDVCNELANIGKRVIVAGLDMDYQGKPFGAMPFLMATAEYVTKVHAVCVQTGNLAHYSFRKNRQHNDLILLGEQDEYEPLSRVAYFQEISKQKNIIND